MATVSSSSRLRHDSLAAFIEWRDEFVSLLNSLSAKLTADETNITPGAGSIPGANSEGGYAVYHLNDSLHATAPVYIRFAFGSGSGANPAVWATVGTSTNGSGVLGGTALTVVSRCNANATATSDTARETYMSANDGFFGMNWKIGAGVAESSLFVCRTVDPDGDITDAGAHVWCGGGGSNSCNKSQALRFASPAAAYTAQTATGSAMLGFIPTAQASSLVGSDIQAAVAMTAVPRATPLVGVCGVLEAEVPVGTTFTGALVGSAVRTYVGLSTAAGPFGWGAAGSNNAPKFAMLWE